MVNRFMPLLWLFTFHYFLFTQFQTFCVCAAKKIKINISERTTPCLKEKLLECKRERGEGAESAFTTKREKHDREREREDDGKRTQKQLPICVCVYVRCMFFIRFAISALLFGSFFSTIICRAESIDCVTTWKLSSQAWYQHTVHARKKRERDIENVCVCRGVRTELAKWNMEKEILRNSDLTRAVCTLFWLQIEPVLHTVT